MQDWGAWVLDDGLPALPTDVAVGESVPVARWCGPRYGAVLFVEWSWSEDHEDDSLRSEVQIYRRAPDRWEPSNGSGGGGWFDPPLVPPPVPPRAADLWHFHASGGDDWRGCAAFGLAGSDAAVIEVSDVDGLTRRPIESPIGALVVCSDATAPAIARVLDRQGQVLTERAFSPETAW